MKKLFRLFRMAICVCLMSVPVSAAEEIIRIKMPTHVTPSYKDVFPSIQRFTDRINELGKDKIEAKLFHSESLIKAKDIVPALMNGGCGIIFHTSSHTTDIWPEIGGLSLPFLYQDEKDCKDHWTAGKPVFELVNKEMDRKYGVRILASGILKGLILATRDKAIEKPDDFKGLKLRSTGKLDEGYIKTCGASPVFLSSSEMATAFRMGALDGVITYPGTIVARNLDEMLGYVFETKPLFGAWGFQIYILNKTFDSWSKEIQDAVLQAAKEYDDHFLEISSEYYYKEVLPRLQKKMKFVSPNAEETKKLIEIARRTYQDWSKSVDAEFAKKFIELSQTP